MDIYVVIETMEAAGTAYAVGAFDSEVKANEMINLFRSAMESGKTRYKYRPDWYIQEIELNSMARPY